LPIAYDKKNPLSPMKLASRLALLALATGTSAYAQVTLTWAFSGFNANPTNGTVLNFSVSAMSTGNPNGTNVSPLNATSPSTAAYAGASGTVNISNTFSDGALVTGANGSGYIEFTATPAAGYSIKISDYDFGVRSTSVGAQTYSLRSNADSYTTDIVTGSITADAQWRYTDTSFAAITYAPNAAVIFRLYGYGGSGASVSSTNTRFDDITVVLTAVAIPEPATYGALLALAVLVKGAVARRRRQVS
jgi:hypothetical protein